MNNLMVNLVLTSKSDSVALNSTKLNAMRAIIKFGPFGSIPMTLSIVVIGKIGIKCLLIWFVWNRPPLNIKLKAVVMASTIPDLP